MYILFPVESSCIDLGRFLSRCRRSIVVRWHCYRNWQHGLLMMRHCHSVDWRRDGRGVGKAGRKRRIALYIRIGLCWGDGLLSLRRLRKIRIMEATLPGFDLVVRAAVSVAAMHGIWMSGFSTSSCSLAKTARRVTSRGLSTRTCLGRYLVRLVHALQLRERSWMSL